MFFRMDFMTTRLWRSAMEPSDAEPAAARARARLREAFLGFREQAAHLAAEIPRDLPGFTVHDITHLDALWETAELVAGPGIQLTPPEAFILGGAILLHDLGMSVAAYPGGIAELQQTRDWRDAVATLLRQKLDRFPSAAEVQHPPPDIAAEATREALRIRHAEHALRLATQPWKARDAAGTSYYLIEDVELRKAFGDLIGRVAHSHHWPVSRLHPGLPKTLGAPSWCPRTWTVDPLKVACLLRLADATHIDARRAPGFLRALRQPQGISSEHWSFQERLLKPRLEGERIIFSSAEPFPLEAASAWWLCLDTLKMIDGELRQVDALLSDLGRPRLAARSVSGIEDPARLAHLIRAEGWIPVDTRIRVGDIPMLVSRLGGRQLYGDDSQVPLRELIQNAMDAVRARRLLEKRTIEWGDVFIRWGGDEQGYWVEVEDNGLGMSQAVLTGPLLEFGTSFWSSMLVREECPGLLEKGFLPTGKYGVGFFSVFMWGQRVSVTTRRAEEAQRETRVLEFDSGPFSRPILRPATEEERLIDGGTRVRVWVDAHPRKPGGVLYVDEELRSWSLDDILRELCPCPDANVHVEESSDTRRLAISAGDWLTMEGAELLERLSDGSAEKSAGPEGLAQLGRNLRPLRGPTGQLLGRACVSAAYQQEGSCFTMPWGLISDGVFRGGAMNEMAGILVGAPQNVSRQSVWPIVDPETLSVWATEQARLWSQEPLPPENLFKVAQVVRTYGGDVGGLPVAASIMGWLTAEEIARRQWPAEIFLIDMDAHPDRNVSPEQLESLPPQARFNLRDMQSRVLLVSLEMRGTVGEPWPRSHSNVVWPPWCVRETQGMSRHSLARVALAALARSWGSTEEEVIASTTFEVHLIRIQHDDGRVFAATRVAIVRKPHEALE